MKTTLLVALCALTIGSCEPPADAADPQPRHTPANPRPIATVVPGSAKLLTSHNCPVHVGQPIMVVVQPLLEVIAGVLVPSRLRRLTSLVRNAEGKEVARHGGALPLSATFQTKRWPPGTYTLVQKVPNESAGTAPRKCYRGTNDLKLCASDADCPGGVCEQWTRTPFGGLEETVNCEVR